MSTRPLAAALTACLALAACGPEEPDAPVRWAVSERLDRWTGRQQAPDAPPLGQEWRLTDGDTRGWTRSDGGPLEAGPDGLVAHGLERLGLRSPEGSYDPELLHLLSVRSRVEGATTVRVRWRAAGEGFTDARATPPQELPPSAAAVFTNLAVPLATLRGLREAGDAAEGLAQIEVLFEGPPGTRSTVTLSSAALVSDFDRPGDDLRRLGRLGVYRHGTVLRSPGRLELRGSPGPAGPQRLRLAVATVGGPLDVTLTAARAAGDAVVDRVQVAPDAPWTDLSVDLPAGGLDALTLEASGSGVLLSSRVVRLTPDDSGLPDVVIYLEDTLRPDRLTAYGYPFDTGAFARRLADEGVAFDRAYGASSWTRPSVSSLLTGLDPLTHGNTTHLDRVAPDVTTLAERLAERGYLTASFVTNYHGGAWSGLDQGFDVGAEPTAWGASRVPSTLTSAVVAGPLEALLDEHAGERVFVFVHSLDPHAPYRPEPEDTAALLPTVPRRPVPPGGANHAQESLHYDAEVRHNDRLLARLDDALTAGGRGDVLFAFLSDHGEAFGEHDLWQHRQSLYEEELRVPLIVRRPGSLPAGRRVTSPIGLADVAPSLLGLLGLPPPDAWTGRDLSDLVRGVAESPREEIVLAHVAYDDGRQQVAAVGPRYKLLAELSEGEDPRPVALFDLTADPGERQDVLGRPDLAPVAEGLGQWLHRAVRAGRAARVQAGADAMDPEQRRWMVEMGYLGDR